ncbi:MAG: ATP cone domain-containing protein [Candidatus Taylorbacteria bacterium]|nr:ATP cone domain-containing protein [Candidatus Taylorbacteria bacterium]
MAEPLLVTKSDGTKELFDDSKLATSLKRSGASSEAVDEITDEIEREMWDGMTTADIYSHAFSLLKKHHHPTAIKYSLRRALFDLGPDGFPFEKFVARIFQLWGYDAVTDQTLIGTCVEHEVDVVAWKGDELAMIEAKFHNELGLRSDVKVALYVKARFDDLSENTYDFGGKPRKLSPTGRWLITNTKFTDIAIKYGECKGLKLIGWNYPNVNNLHQIMEQNGLHPITCLNSLSHQDKKNIIGQGVLTCIDIIGKPDVLARVGIRKDLIEKVLTEAQFIVEQAK